MDEDFLKKLGDRKGRLKRRLVELNETIEIDLAFAVDRYDDARGHSFFTLEERLQDYQILFQKILDQVDEATTLADLDRTAGRVSYVEDRLDELESQLYNRPRRKRRRPFNLADFFSQFSQNGSETASHGEISSLTQAYQILGVEEGTGMTEVTAAFRRYAKEYHPDARGGDRSTEAELRKVVEAYQMIKQHFAD
ncbi:DnaJ domain-containing protein [Candidatus Manganitrophus noduliformans]|uniref:DnaJ domain-containing protein n=1 Tax=Candidatus Manganitrophus noduliformans TaxID=2606439 RepID=A0A7X6DM88_9BACT|nr:DnaJ domain-containing protein [Candidatus Manganitrophus noduliformans]NKE69734.1 DnaJ domain-containing protein [Candidatus Manganitrophus noduliformans]